MLTNTLNAIATIGTGNDRCVFEFCEFCFIARHVEDTNNSRSRRLSPIPICEWEDRQAHRLAGCPAYRLYGLICLDPFGLFLDCDRRLLVSCNLKFEFKVQGSSNFATPVRACQAQHVLLSINCHFNVMFALSWTMDFASRKCRKKTSS
jgi:hypothetical protein